MDRYIETCSGTTDIYIFFIGFIQTPIETLY